MGEGRRSLAIVAALFYVMAFVAWRRAMMGRHKFALLV
jgi:hypothetical protein